MSGDGNRIPSMLGLCNPLLDISAYVDREILERYELKANDVILAGEKHRDLCKDLIAKFPVEYTAGGSAQNVMRVAAAILRKQGVNSKIMFTGCVGKDEFGDLMHKKASEDGVITSYSITDDEPTGTCAVCLSDQGKNRSLCAFLGASQRFTDQHLKDNWDELVVNTDIIYISGFLIAVSPESFSILGDHIASGENNQRRFCLNLSAPYVSNVFGSEIEKVIKYVDIIFGNDDEAKAYSEFKKWKTNDLGEIVEKLCSEPKVRESVPRIVIITRGSDPIILGRQDSETKEVVRYHYPCRPIPNSEMVDTNGAGDSFAGGFLSQYLQGKDLDFCIKIGDYAARQIIKMSGIAMPNFDDIPSV